MIKEILEYISNHPDSSFPEIRKGLNVPVSEFKDDFYNLKSDKYLSQKTIHGQDKNGNLQSLHVFRISPKGLEFLSKLLKTEVSHEKEDHSITNTKKIFISHSYTDRKIADKIINKLLLPNLNINKEDIFYTSKRETGIRISLNWRNTIKENIRHCKIYIALITTNFQRSEMCLNELGAAWVLNKTIYPVILPPVKLDNFSQLISDLQALDISNTSDIKSFINSLIIDLQIFYNISQKTHAELDKEITSYCKALKQFLKKNQTHFKPPENLNNDRKSDLKIMPIIGEPEDEVLKRLDLKYLDFSIENTSNKSIEFDIEMKVYKNTDCGIILENDAKKVIKEPKKEPQNFMNYRMPEVDTSIFDFDVHTEDLPEYLKVSRIKLKDQKYALRISQQDIEENIFNKKVLIIEKGSNLIKVDLTLRSDDFTEGVLFNSFEL